jgi:hypothetical protein
MTYLMWTVVLVVALGGGTLGGKGLPGLPRPTATATAVRPERTVHAAHDTKRI